MNTISTPSKIGGAEYPAWKKLLEISAPRSESASSGSAVFIWQMGKVGSSALAESVETLGAHAVFHFHHTNADTIDKVVTAKMNAGVEIPKDLKLSQMLLSIMGAIKSQKHEKIYVISAVRDPIARNISAFFQNLNIFAPDVDSSFGHDALKLREIFMRTYSHSIPTGWFDRELLHTAGMDIYKTPFDHSKSALRLSEAPFELLVLRAEDADNKKSAALNELLGRSDIVIEKHNVSRRKKYARLYSAFMDGLSFETEFLSAQYDTPFCHHFYTDEELDSFRKRWAPDMAR
jgi:Putative capsular polysaccharide synthesis protein